MGHRLYVDVTSPLFFRHVELLQHLSFLMKKRLFALLVNHLAWGHSDVGIARLLREMEVGWRIRGVSVPIVVVIGEAQQGFVIQ